MGEDSPAEIAAELREAALIASGSSLRRGCQDCGIAANLAESAADALDAAIARAERLEAERDALVRVARGVSDATVPVFDAVRFGRVAGVDLGDLLRAVYAMEAALSPGLGQSEVSR